MRTIWRHASGEGRALIAAGAMAVVATGVWLGASFGLAAVALFAAALLVSELTLRLAVRLLTRQDGLVAIDEVPRITPAMVDRFFDHGFDPELGWIRKPATEKRDLGRYPYRIDERGSRANPGHERLPPLISTYGDSYTFCREVEDRETWQWYLAERAGSNVLNFGVGNYGLDQALLRFERDYPRNPTPVVIMGVVPSTIARILSVWKHYNEYGNLFAFKPRFILERDVLRLVPTPIDCRDKFFALADFLTQINRDDYFFERRFQREAFRPPYLASAVANWRALMLAPAKAARRLGVRAGLDEAPFAHLVAALDGGGVRQTAALFRDDAATRLFARLAEEFARRSEERGAKPVLALLPMKDDLHYIVRHGHFYESALNALKTRMVVVDAAAPLLASGPIRPLFREWHYSPLGNAVVADVLHGAIQALLPGDAAPAAMPGVRHAAHG